MKELKTVKLLAEVLAEVTNNEVTVEECAGLKNENGVETVVEVLGTIDGGTFTHPTRVLFNSHALVATEEKVIGSQLSEATNNLHDALRHRSLYTSYALVELLNVVDTAERVSGLEIDVEVVNGKIENVTQNEFVNFSIAGVYDEDNCYLQIKSISITVDITEDEIGYIIGRVKSLIDIYSKVQAFKGIDLTDEVRLMNRSMFIVTMNFEAVLEVYNKVRSTLNKSEAVICDGHFKVFSDFRKYVKNEMNKGTVKVADKLFTAQKDSETLEVKLFEAVEALQFLVEINKTFEYGIDDIMTQSNAQL